MALTAQSTNCAQHELRRALTTQGTNDARTAARADDGLVATSVATLLAVSHYRRLGVVWSPASFVSCVGRALRSSVSRAVGAVSSWPFFVRLPLLCIALFRRRWFVVPSLC